MAGTISGGGGSPAILIQWRDGGLFDWLATERYKRGLRLSAPNPGLPKIRRLDRVRKVTTESVGDSGAPISVSGGQVSYGG